MQLISGKKTKKMNPSEPPNKQSDYTELSIKCLILKPIPRVSEAQLKSFCS